VNMVDESASMEFGGCHSSAIRTTGPQRNGPWAGYPSSPAITPEPRRLLRGGLLSCPSRARASLPP
jgi:hypothetical protein